MISYWHKISLKRCSADGCCISLFFIQVRLNARQKTPFICRRFMVSVVYIPTSILPRAGVGIVSLPSKQTDLQTTCGSFSAWINNSLYVHPYRMVGCLHAINGLDGSDDRCRIVISLDSVYSFGDVILRGFTRAETIATPLLNAGYKASDGISPYLWPTQAKERCLVVSSQKDVKKTAGP